MLTLIETLHITSIQNGIESHPGLLDALDKPPSIQNGIERPLFP